MGRIISQPQGACGHISCVERRTSNGQRPGFAAIKFSEKVAPRIAQHVIEIRSAHRNFGARQLRSHFGRNPPQLRIEPQAGFPRRRNLCRQKRHSEPSPAHFVQLADLALQIGDHLPIRQPAIVQPFRKRGQLFAIFDPGSIFRLAEELFPGQGAALSTAWRVRQFEYTWLRNSMHQYKDFYGVTQDALIFASKQTRIELHPEQMGRLAFGGPFGGQTGLVLTASAGQSVALIQPHPGVRFRSLEESMRQTDW